MLSKIDFNHIQTRDTGRIISLQRNIQKRAQKKQPVDQLAMKLERLAESSQSKTQAIKADIPAIQLQFDLPIAGKADEIIRLLKEHQIIIVAGETGCGKTTQLPKICLQAGLGVRGEIGHTQPRRVAATSVARRIAEEVDSELGGLVGYSIRFNNKLSEKTRVKLMTDGILLSELETDPLLSRYEVIIIDEAHERSLNIDFLLGFLKRIVARRNDLKIIITSATIDPERFSKNFNDAPIVQVEGRSYPVEVRYRPLEDREQDNSADNLINGIVAAVDECSAESRGDILIFADGEGQIKTIVKQLARANLEQTEILPLYARLGLKEQQKIFAPNNKRKIIVSTNVAETSLTVPGIIFVIDIGTARVSRFSQRNKIQQLPVEKVSRASADQRKGRCGRIAPGICIRLFDEDDYLQREDFTPPEIKRTNLSSVVLRLKAMGVDDVESFPFMELPGERAWKVAFNSLFELAAIDEHQHITKIGKRMAQLPVDPQLARILVDPNLKAINEMLIFCSLMSVREVRERPHERQQKADQLHKKYHDADSDVLTAIKLWNTLEEQKKALSSNAFKNWCRDNLINFLGLLEWRRVYYQLKESLENLSVKINQSAVHPDDVHRALVPGFITHIFYRSQEVYYQGVRGLKVWIHPSSLSFKKSKAWLLSAEMIETEKLYARMNAPIDPKWVETAAPHLLKSNYKDIHWRKNKGQVMAMLNQTLLGLPIVTQRLVNYSNIDPAASRKLFLVEGLAADQLSENFPFLQANRKKLLVLEEQEKRQRLNNIRIDAESLANLYDEHLPEQIVSQVSLKRWLKKDFKKHNKQLTFSIEQLTRNQVSCVEDYPSQITIKGFQLNLSYTFAPGTPEDGVSVEIPPNMLKQFGDRDFDWLVPGYLQEKILASIKTLPKSIRRSLIPLSDTAAYCFETLMKIDQQGKRFVDELAKTLQRYSGQHIKPTDFDLDNLEPHLSMKFKLLQKRGSVAFQSLAQIKSSPKHSPAIKQQASVEVLTDWPAQVFEIEKTLTNDNHVSRVFQALDDLGEQVAIKQFPSRAIAEKRHLLGTAKLILLNNKSSLNKFINSWPDKNLLERLNLRAGGFKPIVNAMALGVAKKLIENQSPDHAVVRDKNTFNQLVERFEQTFRKSLAERLNAIVPILKQREKVHLQISDLNENAFTTSISDMREQLASLWQERILLSASNDIFERYKRYHKGLEARIKRIRTNYPKEEQALEVWLEWHQWWKELTETSKLEQIGEPGNQLYWMLQEYRISLFSPGVKVMDGVSAKKLQTKFESVDELLRQL